MLTGLDALTLVAGYALAGSRIHFMPTNLLVQSQGHTAYLDRDGLNGCPQGRVLPSMLLHHAYSAFANFRGKTI